jgi:hypothetical protein
MAALFFKKDQNLYVRSMQKTFRVVAIFDDVSDSNAYMESDPDVAVIAYFPPLIFVANKYSEEKE